MKALRTVIALTLILALVFSLSANAFAAPKAPLYIADVMVGMGESADEAKNALTGEGFTVFDKNLNEGAGSAMKTEKFVYLGYKTTENPLEALTDLAVMNMNGGYSFSDYAVLMDKYRDSQIKPFVDSFMASIEEYRANYNSDIDANRAKAEYAYTVLSKIFNEDCGNNMAELLLNPTKEEQGLTDEQYKALSAEEKKTTVDLTTTLMQGNTQVVMLLEQILALATDTNETTWLQRLSELGPEGLDEQYAQAGVRPADASREMASLYNDTARALLGSWEATRTMLLDYEASLAGENDEKDAEPQDVSELLQIGVADIEPHEVNVANPGDMVEMINRNMEASAEIAEGTADTRAAALYAVLKETPYGEGTMYDFFTKPYDEVSGENVSALYPLVSTLTEGQVAAIDFLPLTTMLQIGATDCESYMDCGLENSDLLEVIENTGSVSIFVNVNREIFGKTTALTSEALREQSLSGKGWLEPDSDLLGLSRLTVLSWAATAVSLTTTIVAAYKATGYYTTYKKLTDAWAKVGDFSTTTLARCEGISLNAIDLDSFGISKSDMIDELLTFTKFKAARTVNGIKVSYAFDVKSFFENSTYMSEILDGVEDAVDEYYYPAFEDLQSLAFAGKEDKVKLILTNANDAIRRAQEFDGEGTMGLHALAQEYGKTANQELTLELSDDAAKALKLDDVDEAGELNAEIRDSMDTVDKAQTKWSNLKTAGTVITALLAIGSIALTVYDLYRYYNVNYTPIPQYIVDEADITYTDANGTQLVTRNDTAYYRAVLTNRPESHDQYKSLNNYADLNGDAGKEWLALYSVRLDGGEPILADSFQVVTGSTSIPEGYTKGIHMFGSNAAANLTDSRYTYNDDLNGIYLYFKTEAAAAAGTASAFSRGSYALVGGSGLVIGAALGAALTLLIKRKKSAAAA